MMVLLFLISPEVFAQVVNVTGTVRSSSNETLSGAFISVYPDSVTSLTDSTGRFAVTVPQGRKTIIVTHVGYQAHRATVDANRATVALRIQLAPYIQELGEIVVEGRRSGTEDLFDSNQTSSHFLSPDDIKSIPVLGGEADVIKTLQLLPGTIRGVEGSSDLFVRGGAADQNLVLLDEIPIYNTSHLFGFLSVFNPDVLDHVEAINGGFPAMYGGRLSSILNVRTKNTIADRTHVSGDVGLISSRLFIEQPIVKDRASIWIAGRRTYIDQVMKLVNQPLPYYFYDFNAKIVLRPTDRDHFELTHYSGTDELSWFRDRNNDGDGFYTGYGSGNSSQALRWGRSYAKHWSSSATLLRTRYNYHIRNAFETNELIAHSAIEDYGLRLVAQHDSVGRTGIFSAGLDVTHHDVSPSVINASGAVTSVVESSETPARQAMELGIFVQYEWTPVAPLRLNLGVRASAAVVGERMYHFPEPRVSARYAIDERTALKASYSRMAQYIHRISNSSVSTPTDLWYPVTDSVRPQTSHQFALAWIRKFPSHNFYVSVESYYKNMNDLIGYEEGTNLFLNNDFESRLLQGKGKSYGLEVLLKKDAGRFTGWVSYTLSWSWRQFDAINSGRWFPSRYDRRHNAAIVAQYALNDRWSVSMVWEYISGARFTPVIGQYIVPSPTLAGVDLIPVYSTINGVKMSDSHRLDLGMKFNSKPGRNFHWHVFAGAYNVYNRANPIGITIEQDEMTGILKYRQPGLFGFLPFISYGFGF